MGDPADGDLDVVLGQGDSGTSEDEELKGTATPNDIVVGGDSGEEVGAHELVVLGGEPVHRWVGRDFSGWRNLVVLVVDSERARLVAKGAHQERRVGDASELDPFGSLLSPDSVVT